MRMLADKSEKGIVHTDALLAGLRSTNILSVLATLEVVGSSETFLLLSAILIHQSNYYESWNSVSSEASAVVAAVP